MVWELGRWEPEPSPGPWCCFPDAGTRMHSAFLETDESLPDGGRALKENPPLKTLLAFASSHPRPGGL